MFTLNEVIEGLKAGKSYQRKVRDTGDTQHLIPTGDGGFHRHVYDQAGNHCIISGSAMPISTLENRGWEQDGWELQS